VFVLLLSRGPVADKRTPETAGRQAGLRGRTYVAQTKLRDRTWRAIFVWRAGVVEDRVEKRVGGGGGGVWAPGGCAAGFP